MSHLSSDFRAHVLSTSIPDCAVKQEDADHISLTTKHAVGRVGFYDLGDEFPEIVELSVVDPKAPDDPKFFLHFELDDEKRAKDLFSEMVEQLQQQDQFGTTRVLLCCTAGLTTTMFANKLQQAADTLSINYRFEAMPLEQAKADGGDFDAVLLAPQVGYQRKEVMQSFPEAAVVQIPAKIFAAYDAGACLKMVMHLLSDNTVFSTSAEDDLKMVRKLANDYKVMVITVIKRPRNSWLGWRIYDQGEVVLGGSVTKCKHDPRDIEDLISSLPLHDWNASDLDAIGIAVPGIVSGGAVVDTYTAMEAEHKHIKHATDYEIGRSLSERYGTKVFVDNNANAAAVGCYVSQDEYDSVVLHTQQTGYLVGGQGIVVDGHLLRGHRNFAGELTPIFNAVHGSWKGRNYELAWTPEGMRSIVAPILTADVSLVAPDAIYVAVDLLDDMEALRKEMSGYFANYQTDYMPALIRVTDYRERIALGELALCLQKLHNPRSGRKHE